MAEERKLVSILFADVTGSTALADTLDPEDVRALMSRYYDHALRIIPAYGGTLEKFIGDAVMAIFGLARAHDDDAERALAAALALRDAILGDEILGPLFQLRIGINTGEVVATSNHQNLDFLVTGDAVNISARLQQGAVPDEIIVSERTANATQHAFLFNEPREIQAKGKPLPLRVFPLKCPRSKRQVERPPFVGRRQDLLQLELMKERTLEENRPQLVSLIAPAGTGKSRLLEEFLHRLQPKENFHVAISRCLPYGQILTFWPLRSLLTELLQAEPGKELVQTVFTQGGYSQEDATRLAKLVLASLGIEGQTTTDHESIFTAWRLLIEVFALRSPLILIFEDLHWASDSLIDIVEYITNVRVSAPLLLITLSRPELLDRHPTWGGGRQNYMSLALQPLPEKQTHLLLQHIETQLPALVRQQIIERSGGNPFFALELLHTFTELKDQAKTSETILLPDTVHAAVLARIDLLSPQERSILQTASVASRAFRVSMIQATMPELSAEAIASAFDGLLNRDLIIQIGNEQYVFRHILIRDVAYGTLSRNARIRLHSKIAQWLETYFQTHLDEYVELIAFHYHKAITLARQSTVPLPLPFKKEDAAQMFARAGILAGHMGSYAQAKNHLQMAIDLVPETEKMQLYEQLGDSVFWGSTPSEAYQQALAYWRTSANPDPSTGARLIRKTLIASTRMNTVDNFTQEYVEDLRQEALTLVEQTGDEYEQWRIRITACFDPQFRSSLDRLRLRPEIRIIREMAGEAIDFFEQGAHWEALSEVLDGYGALSLFLGEMQTGIETSYRRLTIPNLPAKEWSDARGVIVMYYWLINDHEQCIQSAQDTFANLRPGQPMASLGYIASRLAHSTYLVGRWEELKKTRVTLDEIRDLVLYDHDATAHLLDGYLAHLWVALAQEDQPQIDALAAIIRHDGKHLGEPFLAYIDALLSDNIQKSIEPPARISDSFLTALFLFMNEHGRPMYSKILRSVWEGTRLFKSYKVFSDVSLALEENDHPHLLRAIDDAETNHLLIYAARMRLILAQRLQDPTQLERARPVFERLGDHMHLRKLAEIAQDLKKAQS